MNTNTTIAQAPVADQAPASSIGRLQGVSKIYGSGDAQVRALDDVSVGFGAGDFYLGHKQMGIIKVVASIVLNIIYMAAAASDSAVLFGVVLLVMLGYSAFLIACMIMSFMGKWIYEKDANGVPTV